MKPLYPTRDVSAKSADIRLKATRYDTSFFLKILDVFFKGAATLHVPRGQPWPGSVADVAQALPGVRTGGESGQYLYGTVISMWNMLLSLWRYRHFVFSSIRSELNSRFARSKVGGLWMIIQPLSQVIIYALVFSNVLGARLPHASGRYAYAVHVMIGLAVWNLFEEIVYKCLRLFLDQADLIKKMSFPRIALPAIVVGSCLLNNFFLLTAIFGILLLLGYHLGLQCLWLFFLVIALTAFALGCGLIVGIFNVFFRDLNHTVPIVLQIWFWFTPIVYSSDIIPKEYHRYLALNPMATVVESYRAAIISNTMPDILGVLLTFGIAIVLLLIGLFLFRRASAEMVDFL